MIRTVAGLALTGLAMYALACLGLLLAQRSLIYFPQPRSFGDAAGVMMLQVDGAQIEVSTRRRAGPDAVIYFGGNAEDVSGSMPDLAQAFPDHALYLMHYRGYGASTGKPTQAALFGDALALYEKVRAEHPNVTVIGRSLGSGVATHLASVRPTARLVLVTPYDSMAELAAQQYPFFPVQWIMTDKFESWRYAPQVKAPVTIIAAEHDEVIPRASTDRLFKRFPGGLARQFVIRGRGHNTLSDDPSYTQALASAIPRRQ